MTLTSRLSDAVSSLRLLFTLISLVGLLGRPSSVSMRSSGTSYGYILLISSESDDTVGYFNFFICCS